MMKELRVTKEEHLYQYPLTLLTLRKANKQITTMALINNHHHNHNHHNSNNNSR
jgi:hypothetical protein